MKKFSRMIQGLAVVVGLLVLATSGQAALITTTNGTADVTFSLNTITIAFTDLVSNPTSVSTNISGLVFSTSSGDSASGLISPNPVGGYINVAANGTTTTAIGPAIWGFSGTSTQYVLTWNPGAGGTGPAFSILGAPGAGGVYSAANDSITGNVPHNPFINQTATFTLNINGITAETTLTGGTIMFGTEWSVPPPPSVPEAGALLMFGTGLIGLVGYRRVRRMQ